MISFTLYILVLPSAFWKSKPGIFKVQFGHRCFTFWFTECFQLHKEAEERESVVTSLIFAMGFAVSFRQFHPFVVPWSCSYYRPAHLGYCCASVTLETSLYWKLSVPFCINSCSSLASFSLTHLSTCSTHMYCFHVPWKIQPKYSLKPNKRKH